MNNIRFKTFAFGILFVGFMLTVSAFAGNYSDSAVTVVRHNDSYSAKLSIIPPYQNRVVLEDIVLVAPPTEFPIAKSGVSASAELFVPTNNQIVKNIRKDTRISIAKASVVKYGNIKTNITKVDTVKAKPEKLFTLVRLLNYSPHPHSEEFLRKTPLKLYGKKYWFNIRYDEDWKVINDDEGYIQAVSFEIDVMENGNKIRSIKTPKASVNTNIKKGQILGIAEISPYRFTISVEEFKKTRKGISELVFKLDLFG